MPWRLIQFIVIFAVVLLFVAFNLPNKCDISFGFTVIEDAPVFFTVFASFFLGMLCSLLFVFGGRSRKKSNSEKPEEKQGGLRGGFGDKFGKKPRPADTATPAEGSEDKEYDRKHYGID